MEKRRGGEKKDVFWARQRGGKSIFTFKKEKEELITSEKSWWPGS